MWADDLLRVWRLDDLGFVLMFWHVILFEVPRFALAAVFVGGAALRPPPPGAHPDARRLTISVVLAGHNEGASLRQAVMGLKEQTRPDAQIVVVDDGSTDNMAAEARRLKAEGLVDVYLSTGLRCGKSAAVNLGIGYCTGDVVLNGDIDTSFDRDALERIAEKFLDPRVGAVCGNLAVRNSHESILAKFQAIEYLVSISLGRRVADMLGILFIVSGAFGAFRREALLSVGGLEVGPGEDSDITIKLRQAGWSIRFEPHAWALTDVPVSALALFRQRLRWDRDLVRIRLRKYRSVFNPLRHNFSLSNALGTLDFLFFGVALPLSFVVYVVWLFAQFGVGALPILAGVTLVYMASASATFVIAASLSGHYGRYRLFPYVLGYTVFSAYVLRLVTVYAYVQELIFRRSYRDTYVPRRVLDHAPRF